MKLLFLMSSLRSGSHMVRSMLRNEPSIVDLGGEHAPLTPADVDALSARSGTILVPLKYGYRAFTRHCLDVAATPNACALILHRRDAAAQARSLKHAQRHGSWFGPVEGSEAVAVSEEQIASMRAQNERDLARLSEAIRIPHEVVAYEDISTASIGAALRRLGCEVVVREPTTTKIGVLK